MLICDDWLIRMDEIDKGIIWELHDNCRVSYRVLSDKFGITANAVRRRIMKMVELGLIDQYIVCLSVVHTDGTEDDEEFIQTIGSNEMSLVVGRGACTEGGVYHVFAQYIGSKGLNDFGSFLRSQKQVTRAELFPILYDRGGRKELTKVDLRVIKALLEDARMPISEIADRTGFTARRVRRILNDFLETDSIWIVLRWNMNSSGYTQFLVRTTYDEKLVKSTELIDWLKETFPMKYWYTYLSAASPEAFIEFVVDELNDVEEITRTIKRASFVKSAFPLIRFSERKFPWLGEIYLRNMVSEICE